MATRRDPADLLRARRLRVTPQRRAILGAFRDLPEEHLSADQVRARASAVVPELSRGTVYATLAELTELGLVAAVGSADPVRYEINIAPHDHFHCRLCLRLFDFELDRPPRPWPSRPDGFVVERVVTTAEGICADCRAYNRGLRAGAAAIGSIPQMDDDLTGTLACAQHSSPLGELVLAASARGLVRVAFAEHADFPALSARARSRRGDRLARRNADVLASALDVYFEGSVDASDAVIDWGKAEQATSGTLEATRTIPYGRSRSYERLGVEIGAYACGYSLGTNPLPVLLPCHRVACGHSRPEVYVGGIERLRHLHRFEVDTLAPAKR